MKLRWIMLARRLSKLSCHHKAKIGCVVVKGKEPVGKGYNKLKTSPRSPHAYQCLHAEVDAILNANRDLSGCTIYVYRENKLGQWAICKPCLSCQSAIKKAGIKRVIYTTEHGIVEEKVA